jgi:Flp pilus assembly protein TadG
MRSAKNDRSRFRMQKRRGSELFEFTLVILPFLGFMSLIMNLGWAIFTQSTIQFAVAQGVRYAVTSPKLGALGMAASVQTYVQQNALGLLSGTAGTATGVDGWNYIYVDYYTVNGDGTLTQIPPGTNGADLTTDFQNLPLVEVSVQNRPGTFFMQFVQMPGLGSLSPIQSTAASWDRMEAPPLTGTPSM